MHLQFRAVGIEMHCAGQFLDLRRLAGLDNDLTAKW
jgi:hypothetical protein